MFEQIIEYAVVVFILLGSLYGMAKGFGRIFFSWFSIFTGIFISLNFSYGITHAVFPDHSNNFLVTFSVGIAIFCLVYVILTQLAMLISEVLMKSGLSGLNSALGFVFGGVQTMVFVGLILYWLSVWLEIDLSSKPAAMFCVFWAERVIGILGNHISVFNMIM